ncbi:uncharacterized protein UBRO_03048 [Ustilago bromivora]|uniref:Uncharacterized protein n=1 Tax=Ustilago bromivora TaxID=307758 RepID=A0A1K0HC11_9BASI|nr:uncharacterized protein UBRO_03048 [Ustilago bromivora]
MDSIPGDQWITEYTRWLRVHEAQFGDVAASAAAVKRNASSKYIRNAPPPPSAAPSTSTLSSTFWNVVTLGTATNTPTTSGSTPTPRPMLLRQNPHNLYYLLIRFEALGLPIGSLDTPIPVAARPISYFSFVAASSTTNKDGDDTMSMSSMRSRISVVSSSLSSSLSWFSSSAKPDPSRDVKYIYSCFTKIPSLRLGPIPARKLIHDFEDCPGQRAVPLDVFKNLQVLQLDDVDPRTLIGWDRVSAGLRSLSCKKSGVEDVTDLLVDLVVVDHRRRKGEKVDLNKLRKVVGGEQDLSASGLADTDASNTDTEEPPSTTTGTTTQEGSALLVNQLPSLAWHFLRHLNLSSNNLTFIPSEPLSPLTALTHLDLSSNLFNAVPASLIHLSSLMSLNISDNLIDSVLGIYDTLPSIRVLNLAKNRLESLCGLERLYTLERIDLRSNAIYEAGEVGRLAPLPEVKEVWVKENPLVEEDVDWRVEVFCEFVKEARWVVLDGQEVGFWEKQRVFERVPGAEALMKGARSRVIDTSNKNDKSMRRGAEEEAQLAKDAATTTTTNSVVVVKKHRAPAKDGGRGRSELFSPPSQTSEEGSRSDSKTRTELAKRRNHRIVELDTSIATRQAKEAKPSSNPMDNGKLTWSHRAGASVAQLASGDSRSVSGACPKEVFAVHSGVSLAIPPDCESTKKHERGNPIDPSTLATKSAARPTLTSDLFPTSNPTFPAEPGATLKANDVEEEAANVRQRIARPGTGSSAALARRSRVTTSLYDPDLTPQPPRTSSTLGGLREEHVSTTPHPSTKEDVGGVEGVSSGKPDELRKRIEALKSEVGDDWLRILARGGGADGGNRDSIALSTSVREEQRGEAERKGEPEERVTQGVRGKKSKKKLRDGTPWLDRDQAGTGAGGSGRRREARIT